ncbi:MAG: DUF4395 domain-containing protein [Ferrimicrobium sp.]
MTKLFEFPNPVNDTSARVVAGGVVAMSSIAITMDQPWLLLPLTYGFAARTLTGPTLSPLGQLSTRVITPRIRIAHSFTPGPPKRLAQGIGLVISGTSLLLYYGFGKKRQAYAALTLLLGAASLEAFAGCCVVCKMFPLLTKLKLVPEEACERCANIWNDRPNENATHQTNDIENVEREPPRPYKRGLLLRRLVGVT